MQAIILSSLYTSAPLMPIVDVIPGFIEEGLRKDWLKKLSKATQLAIRGARNPGLPAPTLLCILIYFLSIYILSI